MADLDLAYQPASALAARIRRKELSPVELMDNVLARIAEVNPQANCFCFVYPEEARAAARAAEAAVMQGAPLGPLHGVPIAFKDMTPTRGKRTTLGSCAFEHWVPDHDAVVVRRLAAAGAIMVGKTTTSEFAATGITETTLWGVTRNPWNLGHTPGGSSGGAGAAVAAGCVPLAEGCDMGGSVRIPAAFCGVVGLKPSFGRIPFDILPSQFDSYCHFGPLARSVADAALFLRAAEGPDLDDISSLPPAPAIPDPLPRSVAGLRLALSTDLGYYAVDPEIAANLRAVAALLRDRGAIVEEVELGLTREINDIGYRHWNVYTAVIAGPHLARWRDVMDPFVVQMAEAGLKMDAVSFKQLECDRTAQWRKLAPLFRSHDALLCPTTSIPAPPTGVSDGDFGFDDAAGRYHQYEMTFPFNLFSACPALSMPSGFAASGLPTAVQIVGRPHADATVLTIGAALEAATPHLSRRPPL
ncbi:MAG: amidase [Dongiaceae bacterium]